MNNTSRQNWLNLEHDKKGSALVLVRCQQHFNERSDHAVRLRLIDVFSHLGNILSPTGVRFQFDRLLPEDRAIVATVPVSELKLFRAFLRERNMSMAVARIMPSQQLKASASALHSARNSVKRSTVHERLHNGLS